MDKSQIKKFSQYARSILIPEMEQTISIWKNANIVSGGVQIGNHSYNDSLSLKYSSAVTSLKKQIDKKGEKALAEEAAYIWFNRIVALRFMEVNKYLPTKSSLFSSSDSTGVPEIVKNIANEWNNCGCDKDAINEYVGRSDINSIQELYSLILVSVCNKLSEHYGFMFSKIDDWTALLFPRTILNASHILRDKNNGMLNIVDEDWKEVEIIGRIYQDYIGEKKEYLFQQSKTNKLKFGKDELGAVTQLFTPRWIVEYMVQNTVGKTWLQNYPNLELQKKWKFFIKGESDIHIKINSPEELTLLDPACGSGHILIVGFDILFDIYKTRGYIDEDIPELIIKNNIYGFEIDERAHQLACFAVLMKAKKYDRNIESKVNMDDHIICIGENNNFEKIDENKYPNLRKLVKQFYNGKFYGSLINIDDTIDYGCIDGEYSLFKQEHGLFSDNIVTEKQTKNFINNCSLLTRKYTCVVANPPYMGSNKMDSTIKDFITKNYNKYKEDLFAAFIVKGINLTKDEGKIGFVTPFSRMYIQSYENLRNLILDNYTISSLVKPSYRSFSESATTVNLSSYCIEKNESDGIGYYYDLGYLGGSLEQAPKFLDLIKTGNGVYKKDQYDFRNIEGHPIAYNLSENVYLVFKKSKKLSEIGQTKQGLGTTDNNRFLRFWFEVNIGNIGFGISSSELAINSLKKWFPYNKGGDSIKWRGNQDYIVNRKNNGEEIKKNVLKKYPYLKTPDFVVKNSSYYFLSSLSRSKISSGNSSFRYYPNGFIFDVAGCCVFFNSLDEQYYYLGFLNSKLASYILKSIAPTVNYEVGQIGTLPLIYDDQYLDSVKNITKNNIDISKQDRDSFETSRDFKKHPLIEFKGNNDLILNCFTEWHNKCVERAQNIKNNEEELNKIFNKIYGLEGEIDPTVSYDDITIWRADRIKDIKSLLSYIIGCIMGRYSLDQEGLIYAGGEFDKSKYTKFKADDDGIIPILDRDYSDDDIVERTKEFVKKVWGESTLDENLNWIAESLDPESNKTADQVIRDYYNKEFYDNHCQIYQKRPIYWLFVSNPSKPKDSAFKALVYMHRYSETTIQDLRRKYVQNYQQKLMEERSRIENNNDKTSQKRVAEIDKMNAELTVYSNKLKDFAETHTGTIDLDAGVKTNYGMFMDAGIVAKIKL